jgi:Heterodisulfide reductase, subunit A and related polyferredoxins
MSKPTRASGKAEVNRRNFLARGAAAGVGAGRDRRNGRARGHAQTGNGIKWDYAADVVVIGAGVAGLPAAITARDNGASVIIVDENFDIGGRGILSGGRVQVGAATALQQKLGIKDTPDMLFNDWVRFDHSESRYATAT